MSLRLFQHNKRVILWGCGMCCALGLSACTFENYTEPEIVCWGDSMTEGYGVSKAEIYTEETTFDASYLSYPDILQKLTGLRTYNFGVSGATSEEIAIMQGGLTADKDLSEYTMIDSSVMENGKKHKGDILILEIGSNGGWNGDYATLIDQYEAMIKHSGCKGYIIIGDTDDPQNSADEIVVRNSEETQIGTTETSWEAVLHKTFGEHFINMRVFMMENGLKLAGLEATEADEEAAKNGALSIQLRSDWTHFNSYGYYVQAYGVYQKGVKLGYW